MLPKALEAKFEVLAAVERQVMSESQPSQVFLFESNDPGMQSACENARKSFGYFWRELSWERRRIVPGLDLAIVKAAFADPSGPESDNDPKVEQMWISEIEFDGNEICGVLLNAPNWLTTVKQGDSIKLKLNEIVDWMYVIQGDAYGAYTVQHLRSKMNGEERRAHDNAWGLNFGKPTEIRVIPTSKQGGFFRSWFGNSKSESQEHPMSEPMAGSLKVQLANDPSFVSQADERGWTLLHDEALAGNAATVKVLLDAGANPNAETKSGMTPAKLARTLGWEKVIELLEAK